MWHFFLYERSVTAWLLVFVRNRCLCVIYHFLYQTNYIVAEETGVLDENHQQSHNVLSSRTPHEQEWNSRL